MIKIGRRSLDEMINLYKLKSEALQTIEHAQVLEYLRELKEYRELEEQKLLAGLPFAIGSTIYINRLLGIQEYKVEEYFINKNGIKKIIAVKSEEETLSKEYKAFTVADIGVMVFSTKEAAECARKVARMAW